MYDFFIDKKELLKHNYPERKEEIKKINENTFFIEKLGNMIYITDTIDQVYECWDEDDFTQRKLSNAMKRMQKYRKYKINFLDLR